MWIASYHISYRIVSYSIQCLVTPLQFGSLKLARCCWWGEFVELYLFDCDQPAPLTLIQFLLLNLFWCAMLYGHCASTTLITPHADSINNINVAKTAKLGILCHCGMVWLGLVWCLCVCVCLTRCVHLGLEWEVLEGRHWLSLQIKATGVKHWCDCQLRPTATNTMIRHHNSRSHHASASEYDARAFFFVSTVLHSALSIH